MKPMASSPNSFFDRLPASGLREDAFDDALRTRTSLPNDNSDFWDQFEGDEDLFEESTPKPRRRGRAKDYSGDGVTAQRMCQTEVALRLARCLAESSLMDRGIHVVLGGAEVNRRGDDTEFPVARYLSRWGFSRDRSRRGVQPPWIGFYTNKRTSRKLLLNFNRADTHLMAFFATGQRLIVHCTAGNVGATRSPAELHDLNRAIGRAIGWYGTQAEDVIAVCTPRTERFRKLAAERSQFVGVQRAGLRFLHVDRGGTLTGLSS